MKKAVVTILTLALVLSLSMVFVACGEKEETASVASNAEVLGTTVAVMAQSLGAGTAAESSDSADVNFNAGVNLSVGENNELSVGGNAVATGIGAVVKPVLQNAVDSVKNLLGENGITVGKVDNDDADYNEKYAITITHIDEETAEETTTNLALYIKLTTDGASVEGKTAYSFDAKVVLVSDNEHINGFSYEFGGDASFDDIKNTMIFDLGASAGNEDSANAFAGIKAYGTATGSVVVEMGAGAGISETLGASASLSIEIGKLADGKFGATVTAEGSAEVSGITSVGFVATVNVYANSQDNAGEFALNGEVVATVNVPVLGEYKGTATLNGKAVYDVDKDEAVVGISGTISFEKVEKENN